MSPENHLVNLTEINEQLKQEKITNKRLEKKLRDTTRELNIRTQITNAFLTIPDDKIYAEVLRFVLRTMKSKYGVFGHIDQKKSLICPSLTPEIWNLCKMSQKTMVFPHRTWAGIWGKALREKKSFFSNEPFQVPTGHVPISRALAVPIIYQEKVAGLLHIANKNTAYTQKDQHTLETIAESIAPILTTRLQREQQEKDRKKAEDNLRKTRDELEIRVKLRTVELAKTNKQLLASIKEQKLAEEELQRKHQIQKLLNEILSLSIKTYNIKKMFNLILDKIIAIPWLTLEAKGAIFLVENEPDILILKSYRGFYNKKYLCKKINFGTCFCGQAAASKHIITAHCLDNCHNIQSKYIFPHGHYCVPIISSGKVLGVLNLYTKEGHIYNKEKENVLNTITHVLAGIIKRKQTEEALQDSEHRFRSLMEQSPFSIELYDTEGNWLQGNDAWKKLWQVETSDLLGKFNIFNDAQLKEKGITQYFKRAAEGEKVNVPDTEYDSVKAVGKGRSRWLQTTFYPLKDESETVKNVVIVHMDITERKNAEEALRQSEQRFRTIFERAGTGIVLIDMNGFPIDCNPAVENILGYTKEELNKLVFTQYTYPDDQEKSKGVFQEMISGKREYYQLEKRYIRKDGQHIWNNVVVSLLKDPEGNPQFLIALLENIDEFKKAEEKLKKTMRKLKRSNTELEQFVSVASHDLQEPLRMISSYLSLLENRYETKLDKTAKEFIHYAVDGAVRMQALINDLLVYSRIDTCERPLTKTNCEFIVRQTINDLNAFIVETQAIITYDHLPTIMADTLQLAQVFQNLICNSIKFHKKHEIPIVNISADSNQDDWIFSIRDNGIGIDPKFQQLIFKMFQRLHNRSKYPGTGIGLAICQKIIENHGGAIWLDSELGKGTTFYFTIPKRRSQK